MSSNSSNRVVRTLGVPAMALVLASSSMVALAGTAAAKPMPSLAVVVSCDTKAPNENGNYDSDVNLYVDASYKGKWVTFAWEVSGGGQHKGGTISRWDSNETWWNGGSQLFTGTSALTAVDVTVQVKNNKGVDVGDPLVLSDYPCQLEE